LITVYSKPRCVQCTAVKRAFEKAGAAFEEKNILEHPDKLEEFLAAGLTSAPIVEADGHKTFAGFNPDAVKAIVDGLGNI
jgi:glutaredoxin-like protein NrdH